jgi:hypothetical protein
MDKLVDILKTLAPTLGRAVAGPLGGAVIDVIGEALGLGKNASADEVANYINTDPELAKQRLSVIEKQVEAEAARWAGQSRNLELYYEAYGKELDRGWFWSLPRPMAGWVTNIFAAAVCGIMVRDLWLRQYVIFDHIPMLIAWAAIPAALAGIWFWKKGDERQSAQESVKDIILKKIGMQ